MHTALRDSLLPWPDSPLLCDGAAGLALVEAALAEDEPEAGHAERSRALLERCVELLGEVAVSPGLWTGLAGIGWALDTLRQPDEDPCQALDEVVLELAESWPDGDSLDWIHGLSGMSLYADLRLPRPEALATLAAITRTLAAHAEPTAAGVAWDCEPQRPHEGRYDLGVAHGQPGPLLALSLASAARVPGAEALLDRGIAGYLGLIPSEGPMPRMVQGTVLPAFPHTWCYGPLGAGAALAGIGARLGRPELLRRGRAMGLTALATEAQLPPPCGLCHGPASALILARALGDAEGEARWREITAQAETPQDQDLLMGAPGALLALSGGWARLLPALGVLGRVDGG